MSERPAMLIIDGWFGCHRQPVIVVGETPKRYRITPVGGSSVRLAGRARWLACGETALVPKRAVRFTGGS